MPTTHTHSERILRLELLMDQAHVERQRILDELNAHREETKAAQIAMNEKLDELLILRNKGVGAFWLATSLAGAGAISIFFQVVRWFGAKFSW